MRAEIVTLRAEVHAVQSELRQMQGELALGLDQCRKWMRRAAAAERNESGGQRGTAGGDGDTSRLVRPGARPETPMRLLRGRARIEARRAAARGEIFADDGNHADTTSPADSAEG